MNIIFFSHPLFLEHQSMPRFANMLSEGMKQRGHEVEVWYPLAQAVKFYPSGKIGKWLGYFDQYILFPRTVKKRLKSVHKDSLFVFTDHALGPWVPLVADSPHVIHCHDFLAQKSAIDQIPEHKTGFTGKLYQKMIRKGFSKGKNFISVSQKTKEDLHHFLDTEPIMSKVIYNGLNGTFGPQDPVEVRKALELEWGTILDKGYILHVGGNQWYKNRKGVIEIYDAWRSKYGYALPLLLIGHSPDEVLRKAHTESSFKNDIHFLTGVSDKTVRQAYAGATLLLFPSLAEGFGWPIAEAMASGCPVIVTNETPMLEVANEAGFYIPKRPHGKNVEKWADEACKVVNNVVMLNERKRKEAIGLGLANAQRFDQRIALAFIEQAYFDVIDKTKMQ